MIALLEYFNLEVNEKVSFRSNDSKLEILLLTNILYQTFTSNVGFTYYPVLFIFYTSYFDCT